ncbi:MAG TPA: choice-of-anchor D domain-containing protein, partial [Bryobacteraceae bacterium]
MTFLSRLHPLAWASVIVEAAFVLCFAQTCFAQTNVLTYRNDTMRTAQNLSETVLTPANVRAASFGKLFTYPVDGLVDAQPLVVSGLTIGTMQGRNVVFTATENDSIYAFDSVTGATYWQVSALGSGETASDNRGCSQVTPKIGITSTPVIDLQSGPHGTIYLVAMTKDSKGLYHHRLHALDITTGAEQFGGPVEIQATYPGTGDNSSNGNIVFDPKQYKERTALLLVNGILYTSWASHCDIRPYTGWTMGYNETTLAQTSVLNLTPNGNEGALWGAGGGVSADSNGNLFFDVANGTFDTTVNASGFPQKGDYGNAFVKVALVNGVLTPLDYWTMDNTTQESNGDVDLGSGGVLLLPDLRDSMGNVHHLGTGVGKDANIYLFDRDNMGKFDSANNGTLYQELPKALANGAWSSPAWFNGNLYYGAQVDVIRSFRMNPATLMLGATPTSTSSESYPYPGASPSISADGTANAILWAVENNNPAVLHAYDATNLAAEFYNSSQTAGSRDQFGNGNKYITPTIANGNVFVGTPNGVAVFGLLPAPNVTVAPSSIAFPSQTVNTASAAQAITLTNNGPGALTIGSIGVTGTNTGDFAQTNNCPISPATIAVNGFCTINVTFTPQAASLRSAAISIVDNGVGSPQSVSLSGTGTGSSSGPWPNGYTYQATFTVASGQVPSAQTNFAVLISGTFADFATAAGGGRISNTCTQTVGNNATTVPCDLIFTSDAAGTMPLNWEFETYSAATGAVNIWVNTPSLGNGTVIYA